MTIHAVFEDGVFRPVEKVELPDHCKVEFDFRVVEGEAKSSDDDMKEIFEIMSRRHDSGNPFASERHNEHQP